MDTISFQKESYSSCIDDICNYLDAHADEVENTEIRPMLESYYDGDKDGVLVIYTMRHNDALIGYSAFWIMLHPHHAQVFAMNDLVFIDPAHRGEMALKFFEFVDRQLDVCYAVTYNFKVQHDHPELMEYLGYQHTEKVYTKVMK